MPTLLTMNDNYSCHQNSAACVGAIHSEDKFCASRKGGTGGGRWGAALADSAWQVLWLAIERAWSILDVQFFCLLVQTSIRNEPFTL